MDLNNLNKKRTEFFQKTDDEIIQFMNDEFGDILVDIKEINMIVENSGYLKLEDVLKLDHFSIYETNKNTHILITDVSDDKVCLHQPKQDRLPYKLIEGKKISYGTKVFDSKTDLTEDIDISKWNNKNQIMTYEKYSL